MAEWAAKRFWKQTAVVPDGESWTIRLDGRSVRTPGKSILAVPTQTLAKAIAAEWEAQEALIDPLSMPFTRAANAAIEKVAPQRAEVAQMLADYGQTDLLCYRAEHPEALAERQIAAWDPLLDWAAETYGARLTVTRGVLPIAQPEATKLAAPVLDMSPWALTVFHEFVSLTGSLILGLAAFDRAYPLEVLWAASRIDEAWQAEHWGQDLEAEENTKARQRAFEQARRLQDMLLI